MRRNVYLKYIIILILLSLPLMGMVGLLLTRTVITPNDSFFVISKGENPDVNIISWRLRVEGHVNNSLLFDYSSLQSLPSTEYVATLQCVEGPSGTAFWKGVLVKDLLNLAEVKSGAVDVVFYAADSYSSSLTLEEIERDDVLLAYEMNGEPLPEDQGYPLRVVAPNYSGYKWVKWVVRMEVVDYDYIGFWESRGWNDDAYNTPFSNWIIHAILLAVSFIFGGIAVMSGLKRSPITAYFRDLPKFVNVKFHISISVIYFLLSISSFTYWIISTLLNRGTILFTYHGILALLSIVLLIPGVITGIKKQKKRKPNKKTWHYKWTMNSIYLFLSTIALGFLLAFTGLFRLY